ncbi:MAG: N-acetylmuramoyl-L-alanine amidase [Nanoarchaeota archaeon]
MKKIILVLIVILFLAGFRTNDWEWVQVGELKAGDSLMDKDGNKIEIESIEKVFVPEGVNVYDLEIKDYHYYFAEDVLVHNSGKKVIVIDPGHGGKDPGAVKDDIMEKDINLMMAKKLNEKLKDRYIVYLTRDTDMYLTIDERADIAESKKADLFLSIHGNAYQIDSTMSGVEIYKYIRCYGDEEEVCTKNEIAEIEDKMIEKLVKRFTDKGFSIHKVAVAPFWVLYYASATDDIPSLLIELGFITNTEDLAKLKIDAGYTDAITAAIDEYFR